MKTNRRNLLKLGVATIASVPFLKISNLIAAEGDLAWDACPTSVPEGIKLASEKAKARLKFVVDATTSTHKKYKKEEGHACGNCKFYKTKIKDGKITGEKGGYAKCSMLANKYVNRCGWCKSFKVHKKKLEIYKYVKKETV